MKADGAIAFTVGAALCLTLAGCGGHGYTAPASQPMQPPPPQSTVLSVTDVQKLAQAQSETDDPIAVNGGMVSVTPVNDEMSEPVSVD